MIVTILILGVAEYFLYQYLHPAQPVTAESQQQAETPAGISLAAHNAKVGLMQDQLDSAGKQIALLKNLPPDVIIKTVPYQVEKTVVQYVKTSGADFAIVTDPKNPDKVVDLKEVAKLPATTPITLNEYNIKAYKKVIRGVTLYPSFAGITPSGLKEIEGDISRKISKDGKYIGIAGSYNFEHKEAMTGLRFTF